MFGWQTKILAKLYVLSLFGGFRRNDSFLFFKSEFVLVFFWFAPRGKAVPATMPSDTEAQEKSDALVEENDLDEDVAEAAVEEEEEEEEEAADAVEEEEAADAVEEEGAAESDDKENEASEEEGEEEEEEPIEKKRKEKKRDDDDDDFDELENEEDADSEAEAFGASDEEEDLLDVPRKRNKRRSKEPEGSNTKRSRKTKKSSSSSSSLASAFADAEELEREEEGGEEEEGDGDIEPSIEEEKPEDSPNHKTVEDLLEEMRRALKHDLQATRAKRPALQRMQLLPKLKRELIRPVLFEEIYSSEVYSMLARWLMRLPNGTWPHASIRAAILQILLSHKQRFFDGHDYKEIRALLRNSMLASAIKFISENEDESHELRQKASQLVVFWARLCRAGRHDYDDEYEEDAGGRRESPSSSSTSRPQLSNGARRRESERLEREKEWIRSQKIPSTLFVKPSYDEGLRPAESTVDPALFAAETNKRGAALTKFKKLRGR